MARVWQYVKPTMTTQSPDNDARALLEIAGRLAHELRPLRFGPAVTHVYNPLAYARASYARYVEEYGRRPREIVLVGMNPGPWGMVQTGVPFGDVELVRDWLGITAPVGKPACEHPKRPVLGFDCRRREVSGQRLWGWARSHFGTPPRFFSRFFIANYCPLCFFAASGRNLTPDRLPAESKVELLAICDRALRETVQHFQASHIIGVGAFAASRARAALEGLDVRVGRILHPSPASPRANRDWSGVAMDELRRQGIHV